MFKFNSFNYLKTTIIRNKNYNNIKQISTTSSNLNKYWALQVFFIFLNYLNIGIIINLHFVIYSN